MGTSAVCERSVVEFSRGNGAPGEIRTPDPQIRSLVLHDQSGAVLGALARSTNLIPRAANAISIAAAMAGDFTQSSPSTSKSIIICDLPESK